MDAEFNETYLSLGGFVELQKYRYLYFVVIFTVYVLIVCTNSVIVCLIVVHRDLHEPMYVFIAALLLNSLLYSANIYPKLLADLLSEQQLVSYPLCLLQAFVCYTLAGTEFLLLAAMAYDRYVSICKPLQHPSIMGGTAVSVLLAVAWLLPACEVAASVSLYADVKPCNVTLKGIFCNTSVYSVRCVRSVVVSAYGVFLLLNLSLLPVLFIVFTYIRILMTLYGRGKTARTKAAQTCLPHLLVLISLSCSASYDIAVVRLESEIPHIARLIMSLQMIFYHPLFNPIIYGLKMKSISKHLRRLMLGVRAHGSVSTVT